MKAIRSLSLDNVDLIPQGYILPLNDKNGGGNYMARGRKRKTNTDAFIDGAFKGCLKGCSRNCLISLPFIFVSSVDKIFASIVAFDSLKKTAISLIHDYQVNLSAKINTKCFFEPSCSNYALDAIEKYGLLKGISKCLFRLLKCNSFTARLSSGKIVDLP